MTETLFLNLANRARQIIAWTMVLLSIVGVSGVVSFFRTLPSGFESAATNAMVSQGLTLLYICAVFFAMGGTYYFVKSTAYRRSMKPEIKQEEETVLNNFVTLPSGLSLNLNADASEILSSIKYENFEKDQRFWKELRQTYCRSPFKGKAEYNKVRTFLLDKTR